MTFLLSYGADLLVLLASLGAMGYCLVLSRRLNRLTSFDKGIGGAIAVMSSQVDEMKAALHQAKAGSDGEGKQLSELVQQARDISTELEMMIAACHDFAEDALAAQALKRPDDERSEGHGPASEARETPMEEPQTDVTPIFGSRRAKQDAASQSEAEPTALFRHRKPLAG